MSHAVETQEPYEEDENGKRRPTITFKLAGVLFKKLLSRVRFQKGYKSNPRIWIMEENVSLRKLEVPHNESYVWQRQGICFNITALKKVKCLCQGLLSGGCHKGTQVVVMVTAGKKRSPGGIGILTLGRAQLCCTFI